MFESTVTPQNHPNESSPASTSPKQPEAIEQLNGFLSGEISATETYRMAMEKMMGHECSPSHVAMLRKVQTEHVRAAGMLRERIIGMGGEPVDSSGSWGTWARFAIGTAQLFGDVAAIHALKDGEEHGAKDFAAGMENLDPASGELVRNRFIPAIEHHIALLDRLAEEIGQTH